MEVLVTLALFHVAFAIPWPGPEPTPLQELDPRGWTPKPTSAPIPRASFPLLNGLVYPFAGDLAILDKRQGSKGPDTCGWVAAYGGEPLTCESAGNSCISDYTLSAFGCCATTEASCYLYTACRNYAQGCGDCSINSNIIYCSEETAPYCITNYLVENSDTALSGFACNTYEDLSEYLSASSTVAGVNPLYTSILNSIAASWSATFYGTPTSTSPTSSFTISTTTSTIPMPVFSPSSGGSSNGTSAAEGANSGGPSSTGSSTPVGAIAGGAVGGVAVLAALGFAIWFFGFHKRRDQHKYAATPQTSQPQYPNNYPPPGTQGGPGGPQGPYTGAGYSDYGYSQPVQGQSPGQQYPLMAQGSPAPGGPLQPAYYVGDGKHTSVVSEAYGHTPTSPQPGYVGSGGNAAELGDSPAQQEPPGYQGHAHELNG